MSLLVTKDFQEFMWLRDVAASFLKLHQGFFCFVFFEQIQVLINTLRSCKYNLYSSALLDISFFFIKWYFWRFKFMMQIYIVPFFNPHWAKKYFTKFFATSKLTGKQNEFQHRLWIFWNLYVLYLSKNVKIIAFWSHFWWSWKFLPI